MERNSEQMVGPDITPGKRKRSPGEKPYSPVDRNHEEPENLDRNTPGHESPQATSKKQRTRHNLSDTSQDGAGSMSLEPIHELSFASLPVEILQHIVSFVDPFCLGRLMCVNKCLYGLLDPSQEPVKSSGLMTKLQWSTRESLWSNSRKTYLPGMPHPLKSVTELHMFRLIYGKRCQRCHSLPKAATKGPNSSWNSGPGPYGIRAIWPFKVKLCATCLDELLLKEMDLSHFDSSLLQEGLLSASFTPSLHYVMFMTLNTTPVPSGLQLTKRYYRPQAEEMQRAGEKAKMSGATAYESWFQRLKASREEALTDTIRLEAWEISQAAEKNSTLMVPQMGSRSSASGSSMHSDTLSRNSRPFQARSVLSVPGSKYSGTLPLQGTNPQTHGLRKTPLQDYRPKILSQYTSQARPLDNVSNAPRSPAQQGSKDIMKMKGEKRYEIQRRCMQLIPPIVPAVLDRLPAFQSAMQGLMPFDDDTWERLKPQLINQVPLVAFSHQTDQDSILYGKDADAASIRRPPTFVAEPMNEDPEVLAHRPVREKLNDFAQEYVHRHYADGHGISHGTAPQFAADVLRYTRERFYQNQKQEDAAFAARGQLPPDEGPGGKRARELRLEHMRHVFEHSVKPYTEFIRKDLFLCNACDTQGRHFLFEAIIQHYASKHTDKFSRGNAVVYWKAEWPEEPPFHPNPGGSVDHTALSSYGPTAVQQSFGLNNPDAANIPTGLSDDRIYPNHGTGTEAHRRLEAWRDNARNTHQVFSADTQDVVMTEPPPSNRMERYDAEPYPASRLYAPEYRNYVHHDPEMQRQLQLGSMMPLDVESYSQQRTQLHRRRADLPPQPAPYHQQHQQHQQQRPLDLLHTADTELGQFYPSARSRTSDTLREHSSVHSGMDNQPLGTFPSETQAHNTSRNNSRPSSVQQPRQLNNRTPIPSENSRPQSHLAREFRRSPLASDLLQNNPSTTIHTADVIQSDQRMSMSVDPLVPSSLSDRTVNAAERFLQSFDPISPDDEDKEQPGSRSLPRLAQPPSRDEYDRRDFDRRPNISQRRSRTRLMSDGDQEPTSGPSAIQSRDQYEQHPQYMASARSLDYQHPIEDEAIVDRSGHRVDQAIPIVRPRYPEEAEPDFREAHPGERRIFYRQPLFVDQYGRPVEPPSPEMVYQEVPRYRTLRDLQYERAIYTNEPRAPQVYREYPPIERREPMWDSDNRALHAERHVREQPSGPRYVHYERLPDREEVYEDDGHYYHEASGRPAPERPMNPRYERR